MDQDARLQLSKRLFYARCRLVCLGVPRAWDIPDEYTQGVACAYDAKDFTEWEAMMEGTLQQPQPPQQREPTIEEQQEANESFVQQAKLRPELKDIVKVTEVKK